MARFSRVYCRSTNFRAANAALAQCIDISGKRASIQEVLLTVSDWRRGALLLIAPFALCTIAWLASHASAETPVGAPATHPAQAGTDERLVRLPTGRSIEPATQPSENVSAIQNVGSLP